MDRLTSLQAFVRVVDCGSFSGAARQLNRSVTSVSAHVQALEDRLGVRLLNRTTRRVDLTEIGQAYYERAAQILADLQEADDIASMLHATPRGVLKVFLTLRLERFLTPIISEFTATYPAVTIELTAGQAMPDLVEHGYDVAIRGIGSSASSLVVRRLSSWRHVLCCAPAYLARRPEPRTITDLLHHNCLRYAHYPFSDGWRFEGPNDDVVTVPISGNVVTNSVETLRLLALRGDGILLAPSFVIAIDLAAGALVPLIPRQRPVEFAINAVYPRRRYLSATLRRFIDLLALRFSDHSRLMGKRTDRTHQRSSLNASHRPWS